MADDSGEVPKRLRFIPLGNSDLIALQFSMLTVRSENNPEVMTSLVHKLGLSPELAWHDVYSLDDPSLLDFVPRPAHALLLVFPVSAAYDKAREKEDSSLPDYAGTGPEEEVLWFRQTIGNACGVMGILHATCNGMTRDLIGGSSVSTLQA